MSYTSLNFLMLVLCTASVYFLFPAKKYQWTVLLAASYVFYLFAGYKYAAFLLVTTLTTYGAARIIDSIAAASKAQLKAHKTDWDKDAKKAFKGTVKKKKQAVLTAALALNLGILGVLKYYNFFAGSLNDLFGAAGLSFSAPALKLFLPLGISFYTFQSVGYVIDVYREKIPAERNAAKFALFVSFFPQIIQGPISFYDQLAHQLYAPHAFSFTRAKHACELALWGLFKKLVIADRAAIFIREAVDSYSTLSGTTLLFVFLLYALQLYADFSGGIDISRSVAQLLGIDMAQNFRRPYFATTINDYWRRWHITLGAWMREYIFYPIALSKRFAALSKAIRSTKLGKTPAGLHIAKVLPTSIASLIVFLLVGVWHGANYKYIAFGLWNGGVIMLSTLLEPLFARLTALLRIDVKSLWFRIFQMLRTFVIVLVGYVFDVAPSFGAAASTLLHFAQRQSIAAACIEIPALGVTAPSVVLLFACTIFIFVVSLVQERHADTSIRVLLDQKPFILRFGLLFFGILTLLVFGVYGPGYDPAEFVYMQF